MSKYPIKENSFEGSPGGMGSQNYGIPYGTPGGPDNSQNPGAFDSNNTNKALGNKSNTTDGNENTGSLGAQLNAVYAKPQTPNPDEFIAGIKYEMGQQIKKDKAEAKRIVMANLLKNPKFYSGMHMLNITDKDMVDNMTENTNPNAGLDVQVYNKLEELKTFKLGDYIGLRLMTEQLKNSLIRLANARKIYFDGMTATSKSMNESRHPNDAPARTKVTSNIDETKKIFAEMSKGQGEKYVVNSQICDVMKEMWKAKQERNSWRNK